MNRSHYLKWVIDKEWSVRYYFQYDKDYYYMRKFVLKSHYTKDYIVLTKSEALDYIQYMCDEIRPQEYFSLNEIDVGYRRLMVDPTKGTNCFLERLYKPRKKR